MMAGIGAAAAASIPLLRLGPGTDLDVGAVIASGRTLVEDQRYRASRPPGAPVHELGVGILHWVGGTFASNAGSLACALGCVIAIAVLLHRGGVPRTGLVAAVMVANPWFLVAATSTVDFLWAMALLLLAAVLVRSRRPGLAGVAAALAIGCRASTAVLVAALVLAEALDEDQDNASGRRRAAVLAGVAAVGGALAYLPSFLASGSSLAFAQNDVPSGSILAQVGRFAVKDLYFFGPFAAVVLLLCLPALWRTLRTWRTDWLVRFCSTGLVASQLLFLRFPWKMGHLLPSLVFAALLLGVALRDRPRLLATLVAAQLLYCVVNLQLVEPDRPNAATSGRLTFHPEWGAFVIDTQCRADDPDAWESPGRQRADAVWNCAKPWARREP
ncbi:MAG: hypothetical protein WKF43_12145 [Acidimicrobiales bacterium]